MVTASNLPEHIGYPLESALDLGHGQSHHTCTVPYHTFVMVWCGTPGVGKILILLIFECYGFMPPHLCVPQTQSVESKRWMWRSGVEMSNAWCGPSGDMPVEGTCDMLLAQTR